jgi:hypothetical protein
MRRSQHNEKYTRITGPTRAITRFDELDFSRRELGRF